MTPLELTLFLGIGALCGSIQATSIENQPHSVYEEYDELNLRLEVACIEMRTRDKYIQSYTLEEFEQL